MLEPPQMEAPAGSLKVMSSHHHHLKISLELRELETMYRRQDLADKLEDLLILKTMSNQGFDLFEKLDSNKYV